MEKFDFKKEYKDLYLPGTKPVFIDVPEMVFIMADGTGNPNTSPAYKNALEILYGLSYAIKMSKMGNMKPAGYFEYVVPPLEGLWETDSAVFDGRNITDKDMFRWTSMIRQPEFVTRDVFERAKDVLHKKKPELDVAAARLEPYAEGSCVQVMHIGPYDDEPAAIEKLEQAAAAAGYRIDISPRRRHHEIYLGDLRKTAPEKWKTVIRLPVRR